MVTTKYVGQVITNLFLNTYIYIIMFIVTSVLKGTTNGQQHECKQKLLNRWTRVNVSEITRWLFSESVMGKSKYLNT